MTKYGNITQLHTTLLALLKHFTSGRGKQNQCVEAGPSIPDTRPKLSVIGLVMGGHHKLQR